MIVKLVKKNDVGVEGSNDSLKVLKEFNKKIKSEVIVIINILAVTSPVSDSNIIDIWKYLIFQQWKRDIY